MQRKLKEMGTSVSPWYWVADSSISNHESYVLNVVLPRVLAEHNVGRISLLGYANGGRATHCPLCAVCSHCTCTPMLPLPPSAWLVADIPLTIAHMRIYTNAAAAEQTVRLSWDKTIFTPIRAPVRISL